MRVLFRLKQAGTVAHPAGDNNFRQSIHKKVSFDMKKTFLINGAQGGGLFRGMK